MSQPRFCNTCHKTEPLVVFYPSYKTQCKACLKLKALPLRESHLVKYKLWRERNPEAFKIWYANNKKRRASYWHQWYEKNRDERSKSYSEWARNNKHITGALVAKRRAITKHAIPAWANRNLVGDFYAKAAYLTKETGLRHEVDHIVPLQGKEVCGLHWEGNLQVLTKTENVRKHNRLEVVI